MSAKGSTAGKVFIALTGILYAIQVWYRSSFGPIIDVVQSEIHATSGQIGLMNSLFWFGYMTCQIPSGLLLQYFTAELTVLISAVLTAITVFLFAVPINAGSIVLPFLAFGLSGIVTAPIFLASCKLVASKLGSNAVPFVGGMIQFTSFVVCAAANYFQAFLWQEHSLWREVYYGCSLLIFATFIGMYAAMSRKVKNPTNPTDNTRFVPL